MPSTTCLPATRGSSSRMPTWSTTTCTQPETSSRSIAGPTPGGTSSRRSIRIPSARKSLSVSSAPCSASSAPSAIRPRKKKEKIRDKRSRPIVDAFFSWCDTEAESVLDDTPISNGIRYARFCLLPRWPEHRLLDLAPVAWDKTRERDDVRALLDQNQFRKLTLDARD